MVDELRARAEGARLVWAGAEARRRVAELVAEADRHHFADRRLRRELADWIAPNPSGRRNGILGHALGFGDLGSCPAPLAVRPFDLGWSEAGKSRNLVDAAPLLEIVLP